MKIFYIKYYFLFLIVFISFSCSLRRDIKRDAADSDTVKQSAKSQLSRLEETLPGYEYDEIINKYNAILPSGLSVTKYKYFIIFSELDDNLTRTLIETDVKNTISAMTGNYAEKLPEVVTPLIIFSDLASYKKFVLKNYDIEESDLSPFGFFKISKNVIVIRYVTWKGSILHEITHRFTKSDFPDMPSWFDEGLAALHEKSTFNGSTLSGDFSWRIISIRRAFENNTYTGLKFLMETNDDELYGKRSPFYYAQARYLLMMLQQKGLLKEYYQLFRDTYSTDETGITQLEKVMNKPLDKIDEELVVYLKGF